MAAFAGQCGVLALERETGPGGVIESCSIKLRELVASPGMLGMTSGTVELVLGALIDARVITSFLLDPRADLRVAVQTLQRALADPEGMASRTFGCSLQVLVGRRKRAGGDLGEDTHGPKYKETQGEPPKCLIATYKHPDLISGASGVPFRFLTF